MLIECQSCKAKYQIASSKIPKDSRSFVRCSKCSASILLPGGNGHEEGDLLEIACQSCETQYWVLAGRLKGEKVKTKCQQCEHEFWVQKSGLPKVELKENKQPESAESTATEDATEDTTEDATKTQPTPGKDLNIDEPYETEISDAAVNSSTLEGSTEINGKTSISEQYQTILEVARGDMVEGTVPMKQKQQFFLKSTDKVLQSFSRKNPKPARKVPFWTLFFVLLMSLFLGTGFLFSVVFNYWPT